MRRGRTSSVEEDQSLRRRPILPPVARCCAAGGGTSVARGRRPGWPAVPGAPALGRERPEGAGTSPAGSGSAGAR